MLQEMRELAPKPYEYPQQDYQEEASDQYGEYRLKRVYGVHE